MLKLMLASLIGEKQCSHASLRCSVFFSLTIGDTSNKNPHGSERNKQIHSLVILVLLKFQCPQEVYQG